MNIVFLQTADPYRYRRMLDATARTVLTYCQRHGHSYESYIGVKRGFHGWQASFNRLFQFQELIDRAFDGWAVYLDADAYIYDLDFNLPEYLANKGDRAGVMTTIPGADHPWSINSGVMMLNLAHPVAKRLVAAWIAKFMALSDDWLRDQPLMLDHDNDQHMLHTILDDSEEIRSVIYFESADLLNLAESKFIRQYLTSLSPSLDARILEIEGMTNAVLPQAEQEPSSIDTLAEPILRGLYKAVLGRDADIWGTEAYTPVIRDLGPQYGVERVLRILMSSDEYRTRQ